MKVLFSLVLFVILGFTKAKEHGNCTENCDKNCYALFSKYEANAFLSSGKRSTPKECCHETHCEKLGNTCKTEQFRSYLVNYVAPSRDVMCSAGQTIGVTSWCYGHYKFECKDICQALTIDRCMNGGTCVPKGASYECKCQHGFEGSVCAVDIDECASNPCNTTTSTGCKDGANNYTCQCRPGFTGQYCDIDIDECTEYKDTSGQPPCINGGTCIDSLNKFICTCIPGYTGVQCEIDINECASNPCQNGATCVDHVNMFRCKCPDRIYGVLCDTNICHPTPADVVFVLDSSVSMTEKQFRKQLDFVANFTQNVPVGPQDFQISVVTFSFEAKIEFYLNQYTDNTTLVEAIMNVAFRPGATFTDKGLKAVVDVFSAGHGIERRINDTIATRFVYLMTDGMSTNRKETLKAAAKLTKIVDTIAVVGIGEQVRHQELISIASGSSLVYSVENFNSLYSVLKRLVHFDCDECIHSAKSDVAILLDSSHTMSYDQHEKSKNAMIYLLDKINLGVNKTQVSLASFDINVKTAINMGMTEDVNNIKIEISKIEKLTCAEKIPMSEVYEFARNQFNNASISRLDAKRFLVVFTNGDISKDDVQDLESEKSELEAIGVKIIVIGSGLDVNFPGLYNMVTDSYNVFLTDEEIPVNLDVLRAEFIYNKCDLKGE